MNDRIDLHKKLTSILGSDNVYYQPPESVKLKYPCILYNLSGDYVRHANDDIYRYKRRYTVMLVDKNPDSEYIESIRRLPHCAFDRFYTANNLNHFVFNLYF